MLKAAVLHDAFRVYGAKRALSGVKTTKLGSACLLASLMSVRLLVSLFTCTDVDARKLFEDARIASQGQ